MKKNSTIQKFQKVKFCVSLFVLLFLGLNAMAQTTVFEDNFNRTSTTSVSDGGTPTMTYTTTIGTGSGHLV
jgi:predicted S18 family serine protease